MLDGRELRSFAYPNTTATVTGESGGLAWSSSTLPPCGDKPLISDRRPVRGRGSPIGSPAVWLAWDHALWAAGVFVLAWCALRRWPAPDKPWVAPLFAELAVMFVLYAIWIRLGEVRVMGTSQAGARGRWIWRAERWLPMPSELTLQHWALRSRPLVQFANAYYIVCHVAPMGIFLVWLYVRHRQQFAHWRNQLAFLSIVGAIIQFLPVAPPRLFPELGFIDTAARYGPRVYDSSGFSQPGQLAAMPSMHVGWAVLIGAATLAAGRSRWRWLGPAHGALTIFAVTVTAYHWLLDGLVAIAILVVGLALVRVGRHLQRRYPSSRQIPADGPTSENRTPAPSNLRSLPNNVVADDA